MNSNRAPGRRCRLVLRGELGEPFGFLFEGMQLGRVAGTTVLTGLVIDQAHLYGLIQQTQPPGTVRPAQLAIAELGSVPFIAAPHGTSSRRLLDEALTDAGLSPHIAVVTAQREAILPLVLAGAGAALLPEPLAQVAARLGAVVSDPRPPITRSIVLAHRPGPLAPAARRFLELAAGVHPESQLTRDPSTSAGSIRGTRQVNALRS